MHLKTRMAGIAANLDDLQWGSKRVRERPIHFRSTPRNSTVCSAPLLRTVVRHVKNLRACACDQRVAIQELREGISCLQQELKRSKGAVNPAPLSVMHKPMP